MQPSVSYSIFAAAPNVLTIRVERSARWPTPVQLASWIGWLTFILAVHSVGLQLLLAAATLVVAVGVLLSPVSEDLVVIEKVGVLLSSRGLLGIWGSKTFMELEAIRHVMVVEVVSSSDVKFQLVLERADGSGLTPAFPTLLPPLVILEQVYRLVASKL